MRLRSLSLPQSLQYIAIASKIFPQFHLHGYYSQQSTCAVCRTSKTAFNAKILHSLGANWRRRAPKGSSEDAVSHPQTGAVGIDMDRIAEELEGSLQQVCTQIV